MPKNYQLVMQTCAIVRVEAAHNNFSNFAGFSSDLTAFQFQLCNRVLMARQVAIGYKLSQKMALPEGTLVFRLMRLRLGNGQPFALEDADTPLGRIPNIEQVDFAQNSLYTTFENNGVHLNCSYQLLAGSKLGPYFAEAMGLPCGSAIYRVEYMTYNREKKLAEYTVSHINPQLAIIASHLR